VNSNGGALHPMVHEHWISGRKSIWLHLGMTGAVIRVDKKDNDGEMPADGEMRLLE
jgi:taurine dioxygenase